MIRQLSRTAGRLPDSDFEKVRSGGRAIAVTLAVSLLSTLLPANVLAETTALTASPIKASETASVLLVESNRARDLGGTLFPEYYRSPFPWWRSGSDQPANSETMLPPGSSEEIMELQSNPTPLVEEFPALSPYPVVQPYAQPAAEQINLLQSQ